jgi:hypothetical protein
MRDNLFRIGRLSWRVMRTKLKLLTSLVILTACMSGAVRADNVKPVIIARAGEHPDFDRVVFDWPRSVPYHMQRDGQHVMVMFDAPGEIRFTGFTLLSRARGFVAATDTKGNVAIAFTVSPKAILKDFTSGNSVAIDVQGARLPNSLPAVVPVPPNKTAAETKTETHAVAKVAPKETAAPATPAPTLPPVTKAAPTKAVEISATAPAATGAPLPLTPDKDKAASVITALPAAPVTPAMQPISTALPTVPVSVPAMPATTSIPSSVETKSPLVVLKGKTPASDLVIGDTPTMVAALDPHIEARVSVWQRGGYAYILFDRKFSLTAEAITAGQAPARVTLEPLDIPKASGFRFELPDNAMVRATHEDHVWKIFLSTQQPEVPVSTTLVAQPDFALGARYLLPLPDAPEPVRFTDPVVGDDLISIPLAQNQAFSVMRRMADFIILPAAQGLVIKPLTDKVIVRVVSDGIEITAEGGLKQSTAMDTGAAQQSIRKAKDAAAGKSLFDFSSWRHKPSESFTKTRQRLQQTIVNVPERERNRARLELARFYFAEGYGEEAVAMLTWLAKQVPDLKAHADFLAMDGAAKIMAYRPEEGLAELNSSLLSGQPEIELWQAVGLAEQRNWAEAEEKFALTESILQGYPEPFYNRFMILSIEAAAAAGKDHEAADWLDRLEMSYGDKEFTPAIYYLRGVLHAKAGRAAAAEDAWKLVVASTDHLYKIRAELALIDLGIANESLTPAQAADRLEALRFGWRGDDLEVDILHRLGAFYVQAHNIKAGLNAMSQAVQLYPTSPIVPKIQAEMSQIFHDVYLGDIGRKLSPVDSLTLYQQYRNLMPTGADGLAVTRNLAERLVVVDLLGQAGDLLEDIVKNKLKGEDKSHSGARLAAIRLLDHRPQDALMALDISKDEPGPPELQNERQLLRAKALEESSKPDEALVLLRENTRKEAKLLKVDIYMRTQHWTEAAQILQELIGSPPKAGEQLRPEVAEYLVNSAVALSLAGDQTGLDRLAIDYAAAMGGTPQNDTFRLLTQPDTDGQLKDIAAAQSRIADVNLFQGFLDSYRKTSDPQAAVDAPPAKP